MATIAMRCGHDCLLNLVWRSSDPYNIQDCVMTGFVKHQLDSGRPVRVMAVCIQGRSEIPCSDYRRRRDVGWRVDKFETVHLEQSSGERAWCLLKQRRPGSFAKRGALSKQLLVVFPLRP